MRIYNPQNQFGEDLITKILVKDITGLDAKSANGSTLNSRLTALENASPASAVQSVEGDCSDALVKVGLAKDTTDATKVKATVTVAKATVSDGVISGAGVATGTQVADAIAKETARATKEEGCIKGAIGTWSDDSEFASSTVKQAIESVKGSVDSLSAATTFQVTASHTAISQPDTHTIYLEKPAGKDTFEEWIYVKTVDNSYVWEKLGDADIQLVNYYTKSDIDSKVGTKGTAGETIYGAIKSAQDAADAANTAIGDSTKGLTKALADETTARGNADEAIQKQIGNGFSETNTIASVIGSKKVGETAGSGILGDIEALQAAVGEGGSVGTQIDTKIQAIEFSAGTQTNATAAINHVANSNNFTVDVAVANATGSAKGVVTLSDATDSTSAATASVAATPKAVKDAKEAVIGTDSDTATANTVKGAKKAVADEATARKTADAALVASVTGDLTTGTASDAVKVIASTAAGNATDGTGKAVTLGVQVTTATVNSSTKALSGTGLATGSQVQGAIDEAVKSITTGKVAVGQVLTATSAKLSLASGKLTVTPATGVATFKILEVRYDGEEWAGKLDGTTAIVLWDGTAPEGSVPTTAEKFEVDYIVKSLTA